MMDKLRYFKFHISRFLSLYFHTCIFKVLSSRNTTTFTNWVLQTNILYTPSPPRLQPCWHSVRLFWSPHEMQFLLKIYKTKRKTKKLECFQSCDVVAFKAEGCAGFPYNLFVFMSWNRRYIMLLYKTYY